MTIFYPSLPECDQIRKPPKLPDWYVNMDFTTLETTTKKRYATKKGGRHKKGEIGLRELILKALDIQPWQSCSELAEKTGRSKKGTAEVLRLLTEDRKVWRRIRVARAFEYALAEK